MKDLEQLIWPETLFRKLNVEQNAGWPDVFGEHLKKWVKNSNFIRIPTLSLFSGGGGLDIAFSDAGFEIVELVEIDSRFSQTLVDNFNEQGVVKCLDIRDYHPDDDLKVDMIIGGPPCQTFSAAGRRASGVKGTNDPRGTLFEEYVRILKKLKPKAFLFENVTGIIGAEKGKAWDRIIEAFKSAGYEIHWRILDAADFGVPQHRERVFIVGLKSGVFEFPAPTHGPDAGEPYYTAGKAVENLDLDLDTKKLRISGRWAELIPGIPPGLNYSYYTAKMGYPRPIFAWRSKFSDFMYKADPETPVRTIKAQGGQYTGPFSWENRHFDINELKRLQTFPDSYRISGAKRVQVHQIGNSVPPQVGRILAISVLDQVFGIKFCDIKYLDKYQDLGFRKRKRELTNRYFKKAKLAISELNIQPEIDLDNIPKSEKLYLRHDFSLSKEKNIEGIEFHTEVEATKEKIVISARFPNDKEKQKFSILLKPRSERPWSLPFESISLKGHGASVKNVTALWKTLEDILKNHFGIDDLVQLSGYYQYEPNIKAKLNTKKSSLEWILLSSIISYKITGSQMSLSDLTEYLDMPLDKVYESLIVLRDAGYEIRNYKTNDQIPKGEVLIPYLFPTLNPRSLQRFKFL